MLSACARRAYVNPEITVDPAAEQRLAVLPYQVTYAGRGLKDVDPEALADLAADEAEAYQRDLIDQIGRRTTRGAADWELTVTLQSATETNARLRAAGVDPTRATLLPTDSLLAILEVDAIASASVTQTRLLTELESTAAQVASVLLQSTRVANANGAFNRTYHVDLSFSIAERGGVLVYNDESRTEIAAGRTLPEAISTVNRRVIVELPYVRRASRKAARRARKAN